MSIKNWLKIFFISLAVFALLMAGFNTAVDPFGIFGDKIFNYYSYDMTQNPRIAKIGYLDKNHDKYDSYIIGSSKTSAYSVEKLNKYMNASFYNMIMYGGDLYDAEKTADYIIDNYGAKNIILNIGIEESVQYNREDDPVKGNLHAKTDGKNLFLFYLKYAFLNASYSVDKIKSYFTHDYLPTANEVFIPETGEYNKAIRDVESVGDIKKNDGTDSKFFLYREERNDLMNMDNAVEAVRRIKEKCEANGINFMMIASPLYDTEIEDYNYDQLVEYWKKLASVTDFYDFSGYTDISMDSRYFYDDAHFRNCVGDMALAYIFGDSSIYIPKNFGRITTKSNAAENAAKYFKKPETAVNPVEYCKDIPILTYHDFQQVYDGKGTTVTIDLFEQQLQQLRDNGYTTVTFDDIQRYVNEGIDLPEKPIIITIDDGYTTNYDYAFPLLKQYNMSATIFCVGVTMGATTYKDTGVAMNPHFTYEQAKEMQDSGLIDIESHTYDFHRVKLDGKEYRNGATQRAGESDKKFAELFISDIQKSRDDIYNNLDKEVLYLSYPQGVHSVLTDVCVKEAGIKATVTVDEGENTLIKGIPQTLYNLKRVGIFEETVGDAFIQRISQTVGY